MFVSMTKLYILFNTVVLLLHTPNPLIALIFVFFMNVKREQKEE